MTSFNEVLDSLRPRIAIEHEFNGSPGGSILGKRDLWLLAERNTSGTSQANEVRTAPFADADEAVAWYGEGSFGAFMARQLFRMQPKSRIWGGAVAEASTAATQILSVTPDTGSAGTLTFNVAGTVFSVSLASGTDETDIADAIVAAWNAVPDDQRAPATAAAAIDGAGPAYKVTWTMGTKGAHANTAPFYQILTGDEPADTVVTMNDCVFGADTGAKGAVAGAGYPTITTLLANLDDVETPIIVHAWDATPSGDATNVELIRDHLITKTDAEHLTRGTQVTAVAATLANCVTFLTNLDDNSDAWRSRIGCIPGNWSAGNNSPGIWHVAASCWMAGAIAQETDMAYPYNNKRIKYGVVHPDSGDILTNTEIDTLLDSAATPIHWSRFHGGYVIVKGIGAHLVNAKPQSWAIVDGSDEFRYQCLVALAAAFPDGTKLAEDGETNMDENTTTPSGVLDVIHGVVFGNIPSLRGVLRNRETLWETAQAAINGNNENRVDWQLDHAIMNGLDVIAGKLRQRGGIIG